MLKILILFIISYIILIVYLFISFWINSNKAKKKIEKDHNQTINEYISGVYSVSREDNIKGISEEETINGYINRTYPELSENDNDSEDGEYNDFLRDNYLD